jgi:hypothetical protein
MGPREVNFTRTAAKATNGKDIASNNVAATNSSADLIAK